MNRRYALGPIFSLTMMVGCNNNGSSGGATEQPSPSASASAVASAAILPAPSASVMPRRERGPGHGGIDGMLFKEARALPSLTDAQKATLDGLDKQLHDRDSAPREAMNTFASDLATQARAGKIDAAKMKEDEAASDAAMQTVIDKQAKALGGLHDALDASQRKALVDGFHAKSAGHDAKLGERDGGVADFAARKVERMTIEIGLDPAQQKQVSAMIIKQANVSGMLNLREDAKKQMEALLSAFQADAFDAQKTLSRTMNMAKAPHDGMEAQITFVTQLLPVLRPEQREKFAASIERTMTPRDRDDAP